MVGFARSNIFARESKGVVTLCAEVFEPYYDTLTENFTVVILTADGRASKFPL